MNPPASSTSRRPLTPHSETFYNPCFSMKPPISDAKSVGVLPSGLSFSRNVCRHRLKYKIFIEENAILLTLSLQPSMVYFREKNINAPYLLRYISLPPPLSTPYSTTYTLLCTSTKLDCVHKCQAASLVTFVEESTPDVDNKPARPSNTSVHHSSSNLTPANQRAG